MMPLRKRYGQVSRVFWPNPARFAIAIAVAVLIGGCSAKRPVTSPPDTSGSDVQVLRTMTGLASYYGRGFHGRTTASGTRFDMRAPVAAHPSFPFGTRVRVTNLKNGRRMLLTIVDRGPTREHRAAGVIIDVSQGAAERLGFIRAGRQRVRVDVLRWGPRS